MLPSGVIYCWLASGYLSAARCRFAYGQADVTATHYLLLQQIQIGFTFLVPAHPGSPGQRAIKWVLLLLLVSSCPFNISTKKSYTEISRNTYSRKVKLDRAIGCRSKLASEASKAWYSPSFASGSSRRLLNIRRHRSWRTCLSRQKPCEVCLCLSRLTALKHGCQRPRWSWPFYIGCCSSCGKAEVSSRLTGFCQWTKWHLDGRWHWWKMCRSAPCYFSCSTMIPSLLGRLAASMLGGPSACLLGGLSILLCWSLRRLLQHVAQILYRHDFRCRKILYKQTAK